MGLFVILAIALQNVPEGTAIAIPIEAAGFSRIQQFWAAVLSSAPQPVGALIAYALVEQIEGPLAFSFAFAAGAMHSPVTDAAVRAHDAAFGRTATERLSDAGMLTPRCTLMHAGSLTDDDVAVFAETGVTVNHNPGGNAMFGFGTSAARSVPRLLDANVPVVGQ